MLLKSKTIQNRILSGFLTLSFITLVIIGISAYQLKKTERINSFEKRIDHLQILTLHYFNRATSFLEDESVNPSYFKTGESPFLSDMDSIYAEIQLEMEAIENQVEELNFPIGKDIQDIETSLQAYKNTFSQLTQLMEQRGFKDYGLEGKMRGFAHQLEEFPTLIGKEEVLTLRRHEKDYFLRNDPRYIEKLNVLCERLLQESKKVKGADTIRTLILAYNKTFNQLADVEALIGLASDKGVKSELKKHNNDIVLLFQRLSVNSSNHATAIINTGKWVYLLAIAITIILCFLISYLVATKLSKPITRLSEFIQNAIEENKISDYTPVIKNKDTEIGILAHSFQKLMKKTRVQVQEINEQTEQLTTQNKTLRKLNSELDHFLYSTAHDLRSPLTSLLGLLHLAQLDNKQPEVEGYFTMMKNSINKMEGFIAELVDYAKNKNQLLVNQKIELKPLVQEVYDNLKYYPNGQLLSFEIKETGEPYFYSDFTRLKIILNNLISNAIRYMDMNKKQPFVNVLLNYSGKMVTIVVSDNGIGIGKVHLNKIFDMFYRASEDSRGSGLGLFILKEALERLGGKIKVESEQGIGTVFTIAIPNKWGDGVSEEEILEATRLSKAFHLLGVAP